MLLVDQDPADGKDKPAVAGLTATDEEDDGHEDERPSSCPSTPGAEVLLPALPASPSGAYETPLGSPYDGSEGLVEVPSHF